MSVIKPALDVVRRAAAAIGDLLPSPPSSDAPPPDIDGRRPTDIDPETMRRIERTRKDGRGGNR